MIPASFDYARPKTVAEAVSLLGKNPEAKILAGGHSLIPMMRFRMATPAMLIDINQLEDLSYIKEEGDWLEIGAMTRESDLESSDVVQKSYPLLADTARVVADPLVRNMATVGGNIAHADPANDHPATMLAYGAEVTATGPNGERTIAVGDFFVDAFTTALNHDEILTAIRIPRAVEKSGGAYLKLERKVGDYATAAVAVQVALSGERQGRDGGHRSHQRRAHAHQGDGRRGRSEGQRPRRGRPSKRPHGSPRKRRSPSKTTAARRSTSGISCVTTHEPGPQESEGTGGRRCRMSTHSVSLKINGEEHSRDVEARMLLVHFIREKLELTGTHIGCDTTSCGACTDPHERKARQELHRLRSPGSGSRDHDRRGTRSPTAVFIRSRKASCRSTGFNAATAHRA